MTPEIRESQDAEALNRFGFGGCGMVQLGVVMGDAGSVILQ